jgi:BirA family biotin operon repressor/biotin-[acetyl-CoA-carboxylase] ligase
MTTPLFSSPKDVADFEAHFAPGCIGQRIHFFDVAQSTNDLALEAVRSGGEHGSVYIADAQLSGRGRRGRAWNCPPGMGLLFSVALRPAQIPLESAGWIPLVAGLACAEALASFSDPLSGVTVKWPNDIILPCPAHPGWKKLGGILCESALPALSNMPGTGVQDRGYVVIGIGLNLNQSTEMLPETEKAPPTSVLLETGKTVDRKTVLRAILNRLNATLDQLEDEGERANIRDALEAKMRAWMPPSKRVRFRLPPFDSENSVERSGTFAGLDTFGRIRIFSDGIEAAYADAEFIAVQ